MTTISFSDLRLSEAILRALEAKNYKTPTPIQAGAIPELLAERDLLGIAQTGTGKTAAFALPMLELLSKRGGRAKPRAPRALILTPTRELASQIGESFTAYGKHLSVNNRVIFGGVGQEPQVRALKAGVDVLVATPGRLLDLMEQRHVSLDAVEIFVLDEADRMLDMGFIHDVRRVINVLPRERQSLLFSATMPKDIVELANKILRNPLRIEVTPQATTAEKVVQHVLFVEKNDKRALLAEILKDPEIQRTLVFTRTKHGANRAAEYLAKARIPAEAIHGNKSQSARERALENFRAGKTRVLVATDIAARGIDVPGITHVINFDLPNVPESYVHRIGRTARAGRAGVALSFCDIEEREFLRDIEKLIGLKLNVVENHPFKSTLPMGTRPPPSAPTNNRRPPARRNNRRGGGGGGRSYHARS